MPVLHHGIHILEIPDSTMREQLMQSPVLQQAVIIKMDKTHWLIDGQYISNVEKLLAKTGISFKVKTHDE